MIALCFGLSACDNPDHPDETDDLQNTNADDHLCTEDMCNCLEFSGNWCENRCTREGQTIYACHRNLLSIGTCKKDTNGNLNFSFSEDHYCSSCDDGVCHVDEADKGLNLVVGDECNPVLFQERCNPDPNFLNSVLLCSIGNQVIASHCAQKTDTCTMFPTDSTLQQTAMGDPGCILGTCTKEGDIKSITIHAEECRYICTKALDGQLYYRDEDLCWGER